jgi:hypothetical protein
MIPEKVDDLEKMGYTLDNRANCRFCNKEIEWWITPKEKKMPMTMHSDGRRTPHFADCKNYGGNFAAPPAKTANGAPPWMPPWIGKSRDWCEGFCAALRLDVDVKTQLLQQVPKK